VRVEDTIKCVFISRYHKMCLYLKIPSNVSLSQDTIKCVLSQSSEDYNLAYVACGYLLSATRYATTVLHHFFHPPEQTRAALCTQYFILCTLDLLG
jgi:hypothetical protein